MEKSSDSSAVNTKGTAAFKDESGTDAEAPLFGSLGGGRGKLDRGLTACAGWRGEMDSANLAELNSHRSTAHFAVKEKESKTQKG